MSKVMAEEQAEDLPTEARLKKLEAQMAALQDEIDPPSSCGRTIINNVKTDFARFRHGVWPAVFVGIIAVAGFVGVFMANLSSSTDRQVDSCTFSLTYPQYVGNKWNLKSWLERTRELPQKAIPEAYRECTSESHACKDENGYTIWYNSSISICIKSEIALRTFEPYRTSDSQYSRPFIGSTADSPTIISSQDCWPENGQIETNGDPVGLCADKLDNYHVYSQTQSTQVYGKAAIEASPDLKHLLCPLSFADSGHVPWVAEFEVQSNVCKYTTWTEEMTLVAALGVALPYFNNILAILGVITLFIVKKTGMLRPIELRP